MTDTWSNLDPSRSKCVTPALPSPGTSESELAATAIAIDGAWRSEGNSIINGYLRAGNRYGSP